MAKRVIKKTIQRRKVKKKKKADNKIILKKYALPLVLVVFFVLVAFFLIKDYYNESPTFDSGKYFVKGIDVSHHNPILDWRAVLDQNITFAYIKATEGTSHLDRNYPYNYDLARKENIAVGSYHFYSFNLPGKEQAAHFLKTAKFSAGDMIPAIDVEHSPANIYNKDKNYIANIVRELKELENELYEHFGVHPVIYTNRDCYKLYIRGNFPDNIIWMCDLHNEPSEDIANWRVWQFSHKGELPGIDGNVDLNYYRYSYNEFKELLLP
ncbi:lysozyme [Dysgonomonas hofstadii]|uniref:Lysozyme n=1 Tax=Dysgonomonas hofstadii TaxID=637886 RepID=A0A840CV56_9BACT|nr:GH25 family lysozyme [Dysgonomonas hofstadii]MBB4035673.1 lysozyme [Dysgonomonas hofstadii]